MSYVKSKESSMIKFQNIYRFLPSRAAFEHFFSINTNLF